MTDHKRSAAHPTALGNLRSGDNIQHAIGGCPPTGAHRWTGRHHHRVGPAVRHLDCALVHDASDRRAAWSLVLVAPDSTAEAACAEAMNTPVGQAAHPAFSPQGETDFPSGEEFAQVKRPR